MKIAIIHYWLVNNRGGEKVLEALCELYPQADIYTHVYNEEAFASSVISTHTVKTTFISKLPRAIKSYQSYLPLMPMALEELDLNGYDLVISSESGPAKGVIPPPGVPHICYCHSPMRYAWDMYHAYKGKAGWLKRKLMPPLMHYLRRWDQANSQQVSYFVANSAFVAKRIWSYYRRDATVIHPPVSFDDFEVADKKDTYYLLLGQLVGYKKADLAVHAFNESGKQLIVVGEGEQYAELTKLAKDNVKILGRQSFDDIKCMLAQAQALIFPGVEDFGIVPLEAMASGTPVIAFKQGGATETVVDGVSGLFFNEQTVKSLNAAVYDFERNSSIFDAETIRNYVKKFDKQRFKDEFKQFADNVLNEYK